MTSFFLTAIGGNKTNDRQTEDYYATEPAAADLLIAAERGLSKNIWEPACGEGHLAKRFVERGYDVRASDLVDRGYGYQFDFSNRSWRAIMTSLRIRHTRTRNGSSRTGATSCPPDTCCACF